MSITGMRTTFRKSMRLIFILLTAALAVGMIAYFGSGPGGRGPTQQRENPLIATVGETQLTEREFYAAVDEQMKALGIEQVSDRLTALQAAGMRQAVFAELVTLAELAEEARVEGFSVGKRDLRREKEKAIDDAIARERAQAAGRNNEPISMADYERILRQRGQTLKDKRAEIASTIDDDLMRKRLLATKLRDKVEAPVKASAKDVEAYYAKVKVRHILVSTDKVPEAQAKTRAEKILAEAKAGKDFAELAKEFSDEPGADKTGGDLGEVTRDSGLVPEFKRAALALNKGEISGLVKTDFGYHIIQCYARTVEYPKDFEKKKKTYTTEVRDALAQDKWVEYAGKVTAKADKNLKIPKDEFAGYWDLNKALSARTAEERDKKVEAAIGHLEKALATSESDAVLMCTLALSYQQVGKKEQAATMFARALENTESADIEIQVAGLYEELGEKEKAIGAYDMASQVSYNNPDLLESLAVKLEALGRPDLAERNRKDAATWRKYEAEQGGATGGASPGGSPPPGGGD
jgi:parvulin-like peptidyl-prolyl isomerase